MFENFNVLLGQTLIDVQVNDDEELILTLDTGEKYRFYHEQDCCESVTIEDICGDLNDLIGSPLVVAEKVTSDTNPEGVTKEYQDSFTWTFYKFATNKGSVTIRWYGESNGYYSETVNFEKMKN
jgi:hypothetical protein